MKKINLLPYQMQQHSKLRKIRNVLIVIQVAILLCMATILLHFNVQERRLVIRSQDLTYRIANFDGRIIDAVLELDAAQAMTISFNEFYTENFPVRFSTSWFETIVDTLPEDAILMRVNYRRQEILVEGEVANLEDVEVHRQYLLDSEFFETVQLGRMVLLENGMFGYELRIRVSLDEE